MAEKHIVDWRTASETGCRALSLAGVPDAHARTQMDLLIEAELRGRASHGLLRLPRVIDRIHNGVVDPAASGQGRWHGDALFRVDGERGLGPVVAFEALKEVSGRAKTSGIAAAAISNCNHIGMLALYAERVASRGQILIALTTSEALVHPWGGRKAMIGTNPIAIGIPTTPTPFVLDMATSLVSMGQVHDYANRGQPLEPGWALDSEGDPTLDATAARDGAIAPFGGAKGYALGLAFELLVAALTGSALGTEIKGTLDAVNACNKGDVFIVLEPSSREIADAIAAYLSGLRGSPPANPQRPILVPGDRARDQRARSMERGIAIAPDVWRTIRSLADDRH